MTHKSGLAAVLAAVNGIQPPAEQISRGDHMSAIEKAVTQAFGEGETAGRAAAQTDERARVKAIMSGDNAKGREALAAHFAFDTDMTAEAANAALAAAPKTEAKTSRLDGRVPQPQVSADPPAAAPDASAGWSKATAKANRRRGFGA
jgi:hypothetical protein